MVFGTTTQRLTLHRRMAKSSACGHCHRNGGVHARDSGSAKATLGICFGYIFLCQKQKFPLCAQQYAVWNVLWREATPDWDATSWMPSVCTHRGQEEKKQDSKTQTRIVPGYSSRSKCFIVCSEDGTREQKPSKMWTSKTVTFNMDCFAGAVTSVDTDMSNDRCVETLFPHDTGLHDVKCSPDVEHGEVADKTIPNTWMTRTKSHVPKGANQGDSGGMSDSLDNLMTSW